MNVVHIVDHYQPLIGYQEYFLAREHARLGHDVHVITSDRYYPFPDYAQTVASVLGERHVQAGESCEEGVVVHRLATRWELATRVWMRELDRAISSVHPDVIIVHGVASPTSLRVANWKRRTHWRGLLVFDCHMTDLASRHPLAKASDFAYRRFAAPRITAAADSLISVSHATKEYMVRRYGLPREKIRTIPLGVDVDIFRRDELARHRIRSQHHIAEEDVVFVYAGKVLPRKGIHLLAAAIQRLSDDISNVCVRLLVVGEGPQRYKEEVQAILNDDESRQRLTWIGAVPNVELPAYYSAADIGVWPMEVSATQIEAMAVGLPIIVADNPAASERTAWENGLVCREGDIDDLVVTMSTLAQNSNLRHGMMEKARQTAEREYCWTKIARQFLEGGPPLDAHRG